MKLYAIIVFLFVGGICSISNGEQTTRIFREIPSFEGSYLLMSYDSHCTAILAKPVIFIHAWEHEIEVMVHPDSKTVILSNHQGWTIKTKYENDLQFRNDDYDNFTRWYNETIPPLFGQLDDDDSFPIMPFLQNLANGVNEDGYEVFSEVFEKYKQFSKQFIHLGFLGLYLSWFGADIFADMVIRFDVVTMNIFWDGDYLPFLSDIDDIITRNATLTDLVYKTTMSLRVDSDYADNRRKLVDRILLVDHKDFFNNLHSYMFIQYRTNCTYIMDMTTDKDLVVKNYFMFYFEKTMVFALMNHKNYLTVIFNGGKGIFHFVNYQNGYYISIDLVKNKLSVNLESDEKLSKLYASNDLIYSIDYVTKNYSKAWISFKFRNAQLNHFIEDCLGDNEGLEDMGIVLKDLKGVFNSELIRIIIAAYRKTSQGETVVWDNVQELIGDLQNGVKSINFKGDYVDELLKKLNNYERFNIQYEFGSTKEYENYNETETSD